MAALARNLRLPERRELIARGPYPQLGSPGGRPAMKNVADRGMRRGDARLARPPACDAERLTLLELVEAVGETTEDDAKVVATVMHLLRSGAVMLQGNFEGEPAGQFCD